MNNQKQNPAENAYKPTQKTHPSKVFWLKVIVFISVFSHPGEFKAFAANESKKEDAVSVAAPKQSPISNEDIEKYIENPVAKQRLILSLVQEKKEALQEEIISKISQLQSDINEAQRRGKKKQLVSRLFKTVSPLSLSGNNNYCTAGAMYAYCNTNDLSVKPLVDSMIANTSTLPKEFHLSSHPNVSCPSFLKYYKQKLGSNFFDRHSPDFKEQLKSLEKGDIILIYSSQNTSSNLHCVTFEKYENGQIHVKSLNRETDYSIRSSKICCVAKFPNQFKQDLYEELNQNNALLISLVKESPCLCSRVATQETILPKETLGLTSILKARHL